MGSFAINIALVCNGIPKLGVIYAPTKKVIYFGISGLGSFKSSRYFQLMILKIILKILKNFRRFSKSGYSVVVLNTFRKDKDYIDNIKLNIDDVNLVSVKFF